MPFHAVSFCFWIQVVEPAFIISYDVEQEVIITHGSLSKQL
jgi:hypothetical protein